MSTETKKIPTFSFGERLAKARKDAGFTQKQMAYELDVSEATIAKWETDGGQPRDLFGIVEKWSDLTGIREDWLIFGSDLTVSGGFSKRGFSTPHDSNGSRPRDNRPPNGPDRAQWLEAMRTTYHPTGRDKD